ncbi:ATPase [bacterium (Candidatus Blackallbacteria) CG17_big_fil_post_rev_8_21_14_2_50_48_46]|uniref:ATPase n=1 Tax=bacterium (Candidatus Blackallbacteria) CG17_big_fil_post_rev_8_21_14_2_50_48_46 TaxID=2014261 RepID=A0A2M7G5F7_9BACT|nr:MAG: ATPase [bacterium (Candidatus Blackallbacteria) CG18_big_fil_WC_8_21_14_2_50_49_26]PIW17152.1 MAG: ATPase [bacterium (Candidatus Blackallbacteria) CG17_big_fil_post_rev_8_21_14_2_50_48_46]PIW49996.1 MAG: ATPase [bacterium (Candidatus Blackallbacteria) CG13_big_fil_rev_8_21_14_2_50_49_14]
MSTPFIITKASGESETFSLEKLRHSLLKSGASPETTEDIIEELERDFYSGMRSRTLYKKAFSLLRRRYKAQAARYQLKKAIMELGPSGYPFENFVGEIFKAQGYTVEVGVILQGHCVRHEVDVVAENETERILVECKYRNTPGFKCDVKIPLYVHSRFQDIEKEWRKLPGNHHKKIQGWVATNARFSGDAIQYGECVGLQLLGWDYPQSRSLRKWIDEDRLYPLTALTTLSKSEKQRLLEKDYILASELVSSPHCLEILNLTARRKHQIQNEVRQLCGNGD